MTKATHVWMDDGYAETEWDRFEFRKGPLGVEYSREYITAFCGGVFLCDFSYSYDLELRMRYVTSLDEVDEDIKLFFKELYVHVMEHIAGGYASRGDSKYNLRATWWEITTRPMYWAGKLYGVKVGRDVVNPNSGNTAGQFTTTLNKRRIEQYRQEIEQ